MIAPGWALLLGLALPVQDAEISVVVDPPVGEVGLVMTAVLTVSGATGADCQLIQTPPLEGGRMELVSGPSTRQSTVIVNGRLSRSLTTSWKFRLIPERAGSLSVGPFRLECRGEEVVSRAVSVRIAGGGLPSDTVGLSVSATTDQLWVGQVFEVEVRASVDEDAAQSLVQNSMELRLPWLDERHGLLLLDTPAPGGKVAHVRLAGRSDMLAMGLRRDVSGPRPRLVLQRRLRLLATEPGRIELPGSRFSAQIATEVRRDRDPFDLFFGNGRLVASRSVAVDGRAEGPVLEVREPPSEGRPASFTNAVGRFRFSGVAAPTTLKVGDTCTLRLVLTGTGNLEFVRWPAFDVLSEGFRIFRKEEDHDGASRSLVLDIAPRNERVTEIPDLELACFEPESQTYRQLTVGPFALDVSPGGDGGLTTLATPQEILHDLQTIREELPPPEPPGWPPWAFWLPAAVLLAGTEVRARRVAWRQHHPQAVARRGARRQLERILERATGTGEVAVAFARYLAARLDGPPAGMTAEAASRQLGDPELARELRAVVAGWEAAYLGGGELPVGEAVRQARALADRLEART